MTGALDNLKKALIELTDKSIAKGNGEMKCSTDFFKQVQETNEQLLMLCDDDETEELLTFSTLTELHVACDTINQLNKFLKEWGK